jgi:hypothetical protein
MWKQRERFLLTRLRHNFDLGFVSRICPPASLDLIARHFCVSSPVQSNKSAKGHQLSGCGNFHVVDQKFEQVKHALSALRMRMPLQIKVAKDQDVCRHDYECGRDLCHAGEENHGILEFLLPSCLSALTRCPVLPCSRVRIRYRFCSLKNARA